jgi:hypothetical protein
MSNAKACSAPGGQSKSDTYGGSVVVQKCFEVLKFNCVQPPKNEVYLIFVGVLLTCKSSEWVSIVC